jgi:hypothetical protein
VLFTRDLRLHDHPALGAAVTFLLDSLADLDAGLRDRGAAPPPARELARRGGNGLAAEPALEPAARFDGDGVYARRYIPELGAPDYPQSLAVAA